VCSAGIRLVLANGGCCEDWGTGNNDGFEMALILVAASVAVRASDPAQSRIHDAQQRLAEMTANANPQRHMRGEERRRRGGPAKMQGTRRRTKCKQISIPKEEAGFPKRWTGFISYLLEQLL
jgi:hypothetical protein